MSTEVNKERIALWVEALRSGQYRQGLWELERLGRGEGSEHCCLGVATRVAMAGGASVEAIVLEDDPATRFVSILDAGCSHPTVGHLPKAAAEWFGLPVMSETSTNVEVMYGGKMKRLTDLNDVEKLSFDEIADLIEETYLS